MEQFAKILDEQSREGPADAILILWTLMCVLAGCLLGAAYVKLQEPAEPEPVRRIWQGPSDEWIAVRALHIERDMLRVKVDSMAAHQRTMVCWKEGRGSLQ